MDSTTEDLQNLSIQSTPSETATPPAVSADSPNTEEEPPKDAHGVPYVLHEGKYHPPLADGMYDAIILSTGLEECILAGLLAVRGKKVLQIDPNPYYGGTCASLNLKELYEKHHALNKDSPAPDLTKIEATFGPSRNFCIDLVPKLLLANGKLVKMLLQTGVTRYMDFAGIHGSYVYNQKKIYKLPVTPTEALTSSLVKLFQKPKLRAFAAFVGKYKIFSKKSYFFTFPEFQKIITNHANFFITDIPDIQSLLQKHESTTNGRHDLVNFLESKYLFSVFPQNSTVAFPEGSLGLLIEGVNLSSLVSSRGGGSYGGKITRLIRVKGFSEKSFAKQSGVVGVGDIVVEINGTCALNLNENQLKKIITEEKRPLNIVFQKPSIQLTNFLEPSSASSSASLASSQTAKQLMDSFGLDSDTQNFIGHGMALETSDLYLDAPAEKLIESIQLYAKSMNRFGQDSPYLYPLYGLASLPEGFSRLAAIYGGTVMLRTSVDSLLWSGDSAGKKAKGVRCGENVALLKEGGVLLGDPSFFPAEKVRKVGATGKVVRSVCLLRDKIKNIAASGDSAQIIIPARHIPGKSCDVYVSLLSHTHQVATQGVSLAIASTTVESESSGSEVEEELAVAFEVMQHKNILQKFTFVSECYEPVHLERAGERAIAKQDDNCFITKSLDATSHFESAANDIMRIYKEIFGVELDLEQKLVKQ